MALYDIILDAQTQTTNVFDAFYETDLSVPSDQYDLVRSYFVSVCDTITIAENFTAIFFRIAQQNGISPVELLTELKRQAVNQIDLSKVMAFYFNSFKSKTSLYGIAVESVPNQPVARNIVL